MSFHLPTIQLFISTWGESFEDIYHSSTCVFCYYRKHRNSDNKIFLPPSSSCLQQHFHEWFYALRYNSDLLAPEWTLVLFNSSYICDLANRPKLFSIPFAEYASFSYLTRTLKNNLLGLISNYSKYYFKTRTIYVLLLSSHIFSALEFDSNQFSILL